MSNAANQFIETYKTWDKVDPALPRQPIVIETSGGGSGQGVRAVLDNVADLGMVSRKLRATEIEQLGEHLAILVGMDAIAIAARRDNPILKTRSTLSAAELADIFAGKYRRYRDFDPSMPNKEIVLLVRDAGGGAAVIVQEQILGDRRVSPHALQMASMGQLLRTLEGNRYAFAYISLGLVNANLKAVAIDGVEPSDANVLDGSYTMARPMLLLTRKMNDPRIKAFINYLLSPPGQALVRDKGFIAAVTAN